MKKRFWTLSVLLLSALAIGATNAAVAIPSVTVVEGTKADAVTGIMLGSQMYNADFLYSGPTHIEIGNNLPGLTQAEAEDVMMQIGTALNSAGITTIRYSSVSNPPDTFDLASATLWYDKDSTNLIGANINQISLDWLFVGSSTAPLNPAKPFYVELTAVPLPAAAWLFGSALVGAGIVGRHKKKQA